MTTYREALGLTVAEMQRKFPILSGASWWPSKGRDGFRELDDWEAVTQVPQDVRAAADTALELATKALGLPDAITIRWYETDDRLDEGFVHLSRPTELWVRKTKDWRFSMQVVGHEVKHLAQIRAGHRCPGRQDDTCEAEAKSYGLAFMRQFA